MTIKRRKQSYDRLSILPVEILIGIISLLPLRLAIVTGSLSRQWRGLWTKVISINIGSHELKYFPEFMTHITSPSIDRFVIESIDQGKNTIWSPPLDSLLLQACDRNVRELKLTSIIGLQLPDQINLPNLKRLLLNQFPFNFELLATLLKACPSLEDLLLEFLYCDGFQHDIIISNRNLRRLDIRTSIIGNIIVVLNTPKLEQLVAHTLKSVIFRFKQKPLSFYEAEINSGSNERLSEDQNKAMSEFYGAISNVRFLKLDVFVLDNVSTVFGNVNRLALNMKLCHNIEIVLSLIELCPLLDVLTLDLWDISIEDRTLMNPGRIGTSRRVLKRIEIEGGWTYHKVAQSFLKLVRYLLSGEIDIDHFCLRVGCPKHFAQKSNLNLRRKEELNLCKLLCKYYMASRQFEVEFVGMFHKYVSNSRLKRLTSSR
ncbi:F-box/FBD/LRR-repeat protein At5g53840-like [Silene latifolia]|uniref:F-box/FBD/LRR-repeat protein At5g53840-like n=1 Tax=Silene latifolia TaxID=37657 RepID=UPI003D775C80